MWPVIRLLLLAAVTLFGVGAVLAWNWWQQAEGPGPLPEPVTVEVERGMGPRQIGARLRENSVIGDERLFLVVLKVQGQGHLLQAGEYAFAPRQTMKSVIAQMVAGQTVVRRVTIPEGLTSTEVAALLNATEGLAGNAHAPPEGVLLPETYHFKLGDDRQEIVRRAREALGDALRRLWPERAADLPISSPKDAVILASIVEKETGQSGERARVAAVFVNRLRRGMRLQSDPTVIYALTEGQTVLDRPLTRQDLQTDSLYNTYRYNGLPPGPIANPGLAAIQAVLNPADTNDLYFVADGTGGHAFARTLEEHNRNVRRWRQFRRQQQAD